MRIKALSQEFGDLTPKGVGAKGIAMECSPQQFKGPLLQKLGNALHRRNAESLVDVMFETIQPSDDSILLN